MVNTIVVGGGIAGVTCARALREAGQPALLLDRGRELGGRLGLRHHDGRAVDTGAGYFTVSDPEFASVVERWQHAGLVRPWTDTFAVHGADGDRTSTGPLRWAAPAGLRGLVAELATDVPTERTTVSAVRHDHGRWWVDDRAADAVVLAMPDPQARRLVSPDVGGSLTAEFEPVLVLTVSWPAASWPRFDAVFVNDDEVLSIVFDDGRRRGDDAAVLVAHSRSPFAAHHLDDPDAAAAPMLHAVRRLLDLPAADPVVTAVQRWSFARPVEPHRQPYLLTADGLGVCGDAWSDKPRVEAAYLSGLRLARAMVER